MAVISLSFFVFLSLFFIGYFILPLKIRPYWLLLCSLFFYATFDLKYFLFLGMTVVTSYFAGRSLENPECSFVHKKLILAAVVLVNGGTLLAVKYLEYSFSILEKLLHIEMPALSLPVSLGIAFYTLQAISYCADVFKQKHPAERNFLKYLSYMSFFPIIMQGPISRYEQLAHQVFTPHRFSMDQFKGGMLLLLFGLFKKMVIADRAALMVNAVFNNYTSYPGLIIVVATLLYTIQIYTDFSGFTDISRGISTIIGIDLAPNFKHPYFAESIQDFWRRWHISLSFWFKDYIYIPLGGSRKGKFRKYVNLTIVFFVSGVWHGVGLNYIVWGLLQAFLQIVGDLTANFRKRISTFCGVNTHVFSYRFGKQLITFALVNLSWLFFRANGLMAALRMFKSVLTVWNPWVLTDGTLLSLGLDGKDWNVLIVGCLILFVVSLLQQRFSIREKLQEQAFWLRYFVYLIAILSIAIFGIYGPGYSTSQFIYMQF